MAKKTSPSTSIVLPKHTPCQVRKQFNDRVRDCGAGCCASKKGRLSCPGYALTTNDHDPFKGVMLFLSLALCAYFASDWSKDRISSSPTMRVPPFSPPSRFLSLHFPSLFLPSFLLCSFSSQISSTVSIPSQAEFPQVILRSVPPSTKETAYSRRHRLKRFNPFFFFEIHTL